VILQPGMHGSLLTQTWVHAGRLLTRWRRERAVLMGSLVVPVCILLTYEAVLGERLHEVTGVESVYSLVPVCAVLSAVLGALRTSEGIVADRQSGLLSRLWVLPVHRASALTGRLTAEAVRALMGTILITVLGVALGLRFAHGWAAALAYILIPPIVVAGFASLVMALAVRKNARTAMTLLTAVTVSLAFVNPGITPIGLFPNWLQPWVRMQPMSPPIEVMQALAHDGPLVWPLALTLIWAIVLVAVFIPLAVRAYRLAVESGAQV
jgi:ABC-2 type transport system permease protein